jgi:hypothetical protein
MKIDEIVNFTLVLNSIEHRIQSCSKMQSAAKRLRLEQREGIVKWVEENYPDSEFTIKNLDSDGATILRCSAHNEIFHRMIDCPHVKRVVMDEEK